MLPLWIPAIAAVDIKFPHFLCEESKRRSNLKFRLPIKIQALKNTDFTLRYFVLKPTMFWLEWYYKRNHVFEMIILDCHDFQDGFGSLAKEVSGGLDTDFRRIYIKSLFLSFFLRFFFIIARHRGQGVRL